MGQLMETLVAQLHSYITSRICQIHENLQLKVVSLIISNPLREFFIKKNKDTSSILPG